MSGERRRPLMRWAGYFAVAAVFAIACAFLSDWQFDRNSQRSEQLTLVAQNYDAAPVPLSDVIGADGAFDPADQWRPVRLVGQYLPEETLLVRNRPHGGTAAYEVLVPFRTGDGQTVMVDRGWVPPGEAQPEPDVVPDPPSGDVTVIARLKPGEALPTSGRTAPEGQLPTINLPLAADLTAQGDLVTSAYVLMASEEPAPATRPSAIEPPSEDPGPHLSYAIQWILFAIMGFVFIGYVIRAELRHRREDAEDAAAAAGASAPADDDRPAERPKTEASPRPARRPRGRRPDRDMQDEDAILDRAPR